jgi:hypothetical protein
MSAIEKRCTASILKKDLKNLMQYSNYPQSNRINISSKKSKEGPYLDITFKSNDNNESNYKSIMFCYDDDNLNIDKVTKNNIRRLFKKEKRKEITELLDSYFKFVFN